MEAANEHIVESVDETCRDSCAAGGGGSPCHCSPAPLQHPASSSGLCELVEERPPPPRPQQQKTSHGGVVVIIDSDSPAADSRRERQQQHGGSEQHSMPTSCSIDLAQEEDEVEQPLPKYEPMEVEQQQQQQQQQVELALGCPASPLVIELLTSDDEDEGSNEAVHQDPVQVLPLPPQQQQQQQGVAAAMLLAAVGRVKQEPQQQRTQIPLDNSCPIDPRGASINTAAATAGLLAQASHTSDESASSQEECPLVLRSDAEQQQQKQAVAPDATAGHEQAQRRQAPASPGSQALLDCANVRPAAWPPQVATAAAVAVATVAKAAAVADGTPQPPPQPLHRPLSTLPSVSLVSPSEVQAAPGSEAANGASLHSICLLEQPAGIATAATAAADAGAGRARAAQEPSAVAAGSGAGPCSPGFTGEGEPSMRDPARMLLWLRQQIPHQLLDEYRVPHTVSAEAKAAAAGRQLQYEQMIEVGGEGLGAGGAGLVATHLAAGIAAPNMLPPTRLSSVGGAI